MLTCIVLAGQIVLSSSAPDGEIVIFPASLGVEIDPRSFDDLSQGTRIEFFSGVQQEYPSIVNMMASYEEVVAALSDCRTD